MKKKIGDNIPIGLINIITLISGFATILSTVLTIVACFKSNNKNSHLTIFLILCIICIILFCIILFFRMKKYQKIAIDRLSSSKQFHKLTHESRDLYYDTLHVYKIGQLNVEGLTNLYTSKLTCILDVLCDTLKKHTTKDVSACIKLIRYNDSEETINKNAKIETFCRSVNSSTNRGEYESTHEIILSENTDFLEIIDENIEKNYFYQPSLSAYDKALKENNKSYENTNNNWSEYYEGVIVVPIRIETKKLYHIKRNNSYHIIGFLCVDSKSTDAFTKKLENYYVEIVKSFSDIIYILLGQYKHFLKKLNQSKSNSLFKPFKKSN